MNCRQAAGIIIDALPYRDYDCILTVFTPQEGLIKLVIHAAYSSKKGKGAGITSPLNKVSFLYGPGSRGLHSCREISLDSHHPELRKDLPLLQAACEMIRSIAVTQMPGKPAPELFALLDTCLQKLPTAPIPAAVAASFHLKLLRHEGLLGFLSHCCQCAAPLQQCRFVEGEAYCSTHSPQGGMTLTEEERVMIERLAFSRSFSEIGSQEFTSSFSTVLARFYQEVSG